MTIHKLSSFNIFLEQISNVQIASDTPTVDELMCNQCFHICFVANDITRFNTMDIYFWAFDWSTKMRGCNRKRNLSYYFHPRIAMDHSFFQINMKRQKYPYVPFLLPFLAPPRSLVLTSHLPHALPFPIPSPFIFESPCACIWQFKDPLFLPSFARAIILVFFYYKKKLILKQNHDSIMLVA